jgi:NADH-quinone oxidoreductase subunit M
MAHHQLSTLLLLPFFGMLLLLTLRAEKGKLIRTISAIVTGLQLWIIIQLVSAFDSSAGYLQFVEHYSWINLLSIDFIIGLNGINFPFLILAVLVFCISVYIAWNIADHTKSFFVLLMAMDIGISGMFMTFDLFLFIMFLGITLFSLFLLISLFTDPSKSDAITTYGIYALISFCLIIIGVLIVTINNPFTTFNLSILANNPNPSPAIQLTGFIVLLIGFLMISPIFPFHTWLIPTISSIAAPIAILILALFTKISIFGILHIVLPLFPKTAGSLALICGIFGLLNLLYFALRVFGARDYRKMISFFYGYLHAIIIMGLSVVFAARRSTIDAAVAGLHSVILLVISAGFVIIALFLLPKLMSATDSEKSANTQPRWSVRFTLMLTALAAIGIPGFLTFFAQFLYILAAFQQTATRILSIIALLGPLVIIIKFFTVIRGIITGNPEVDYAVYNDSRNEYLITAVILGLLILFGLFPGLILQTFNQSVSTLINHLI